MRIKCFMLDDFIENLKGCDVYNSTVFYQKYSSPLNGDKYSASSFMIAIGYSAVLEYPDGGQALIECEQECGIDRYSAPETLEGSETQAKLMEKMSHFANDAGLKELPGTLDL